MGRSLGWLLPAMTLSLAACPTVDLGEEPVAPGACRPDPAYFESVVWPDFVAAVPEPARSCIASAGCHDSENNGRSSLRFQTASPVNFQLNYDIITRFLNCASPESSAALTKPQSGVVSHGGGDLFDSGSGAASTFLEWFAL